MLIVDGLFDLVHAARTRSLLLQLSFAWAIIVSKIHDFLLLTISTRDERWKIREKGGWKFSRAVVFLFSLFLNQ